MAYTSIDNPELYFQIKLYTGNGSSRSITFDGDEDMQPDWSWFKARSEAYNHALFDSVRGTTKLIRSNQNTAEETHSTTLTAFNSDGFSLGGGDAFTNANTVTYASWHWKAGTSFSNDASATSVGSIDSAGSISTTAGFSIIQFSGTGSQGTVAHGLNAVPHVIFFKRLDTTGAWASYHKPIGATKYLRLDTNSAEITASDEFNDTDPTSTVFTVDTDGGVNASGTDNMIAYCFSPIKGYSKFGSYTGNGNADGTFVYTGFKPAWILTKCTDTARNWNIRDNKVNPFNVTEAFLEANGSTAEQTDPGYSSIDILSNGFKHRGVGGDTNVSGDGYIFMAFAESPFVNSNGIPNNAR